MDYLAVNRANWDSRVPHHVAAYGVERFRDDPTHLSDVVRFDLPRLGSIELVESDLYGAVDVLGPARFDLVYTGIGALCWLP